MKIYFTYCIVISTLWYKFITFLSLIQYFEVLNWQHCVNSNVNVNVVKVTKCDSNFYYLKWIGISQYVSGLYETDSIKNT